MEEFYNKHYIRLNGTNRVIKGFSDAFEEPLETDICINEQGGRQFELFGEINPQLFDGYTCAMYKYVETENGFDIVETTQQERQEELESRITLEQVKADKITELSFICNKTIEAGVDVTVSTGLQHYSLKDYDQIEILTLTGDIKAGATEVPYHADGEGCRQYNADEFMLISNEARRFVTYNRTYFNQAKKWIESLNAKVEVYSIQWGVPLPKEYDDSFKAITGVSTITA